MTIQNDAKPYSKKPFTKPELRQLDVRGTQTGVDPDPMEVPAVFMIS